MGVQVELVLNKLPQAQQRMMQSVFPAAAITAQKIAVLAAANCPKDTGSLARTIGASPDPVIPGGWRVFAGNVEGGYSGEGHHDSGHHEGDPVDYAIAVHEGNRGRGAAPFLLQAADQEWPEFLAAVNVAIMASWAA